MLILYRIQSLFNNPDIIRPVRDIGTIVYKQSKGTRYH